MNGGSTIVEMRADASGFESDAGRLPRDEEAHPDASDTWTDTWEDRSPSPLRHAVPVLLVAVPLVWILAMLWRARASLITLDAIDLAGFVAALLVVPLLAAVIWLLVMRNSHAEARRFGETARTLRDEAQMLERTVAVLGASLDGNRDRLAEQLRALTTLGDAATARLATIGRGLSEEIDQADIHARALGEATDAAQARLQVLLDTIPRAQEETRALAIAFDASARSAADRVAGLDVQLVALAARGREAEAIAGGAAHTLAAQVTGLDHATQAAGMRVAAVTDAMVSSVDGLLERTADAVDQSRAGIAAQGEAMLAMIGTNQATLDSAARESADALAERIHLIEIVIDRIAARLSTQRGVGDGLVADLEGGFARVEGQFDRLHTQGVERTQLLARSIEALGGSATAMTETLKAGDAMAAQTITTTETLLVALDAATREIDETMPDALARLDARIAATRSQVASTKPELLALVTASESTHDAIEAIAQVIGDQRRTVEQLSGTLIDTLSTGRAKADALGTMVEDTIDQANRFASEAAPKLLEALLRVRDTAQAAAERARETLATVIPEAASALEAASAAALRRAAANGVDTELAAIANAAAGAVRSVERASARLDEHLKAIDAAAASVDTRIEAARSEREAAASDGFARRSSALIEAMNSAAIDITRSFAPDVADSAWAAYLKGDRGVFTRRAVRLLEGNDQRDIAALYDGDEAFRDQVNRYIHDFEAMLRTLLATRDGSALSVTLLSSDMGKLYVALAQAIERLR